ncbi:Belongs to the sigma-70 factor family. ECF subfamily [Vibrio sp. B1REV9]|uniref:RNA polymerase sigma factor SigZ n=1 Tax=Vibrio sp. B1REV9 TaxID=2751179 RepID=UPI001AF71791|nr:RNA polymerase sigma factor SigZ [Vibrio sp. B1REV9]CAE6919350.1 Belongs to the sigma-70 factor family. ECF subfamily [Vibrio sp. B1REV9]
MKNANLEAIWNEYEHAICAFLRSKVSNEDDIDDLKQEILLKTYQNLKAIQDDSSVKSWLFQIANNTIIDFYRKRARNQRDNHLIADDLWFESQEANLKQELSKCITPFLRALPEEQAELLALVELDGMSQKKLAEEKALSYSTLKSRVQKSRTELKKLFEECCHFSFDQQGRVTDYHQKDAGCDRC